jgi:hypothetical protein
VSRLLPRGASKVADGQEGRQEKTRGEKPGEVEKTRLGRGEEVRGRNEGPPEGSGDEEERGSEMTSHARAKSP